MKNAFALSGASRAVLIGSAARYGRGTRSNGRWLFHAAEQAPSPATSPSPHRSRRRRPARRRTRRRSPRRTPSPARASPPCSRRATRRVSGRGADVALRVRAQVALERDRADRGRLGLLLLDRRPGSPAGALELARREGRAGGAPRRRGASTAGRLRRVVSIVTVACVGPPLMFTRAFRPVELVLQLLARVLRRAAHQHVGREVGRRPPCPCRLFSSPKRRSIEATTVLAARLLRQQRQLRSRPAAPGASSALDVGWRRVEGLARGGRRVALVVLEHRRDVGRRRDLGAIGLGRRDEHADRAVRRLQVASPRRAARPRRSPSGSGRGSGRSRRQSPAPIHSDSSSPTRSAELSVRSMSLSSSRLRALDLLLRRAACVTAASMVCEHRRLRVGRATTPAAPRPGASGSPGRARAGRSCRRSTPSSSRRAPCTGGPTGVSASTSREQLDAAASGCAPAGTW